MRRYFPDIAEFSAVAATGAQIIPVYRQLLGDRLTPVSAFQILGRDPHAFLLESVIGGENIARYSFIASAPSSVYQAIAGQAMFVSTRSGPFETPKEFATTDPLADLQTLLPPRKYHRD